MINSVVQYFPTVDYLVRVLEGAARIVKPGGTIFVGDVRSLPLLETFHLSVELYRAADDLAVGRLRNEYAAPRVGRRGDGDRSGILSGAQRPSA